MRERKFVGVALMVLGLSILAWWEWHRGGPWNKHVWMSEQIKTMFPGPLPSEGVERDLSILPQKPATGSTSWGINYVDTYALNTSMQTIPMEIDIRHGDQWVSVKLDVCMKHGEWRVLP